MKRFYGLVFGVILMLSASTGTVVAAPKHKGLVQKTVTASAVIVPAQVADLGFVISGIAKDISIQEGDSVEAGQTLMVLDTPDLQFAVAGAEAGLRVAQADAEIRSNDIIRKFIINYRTFSVEKLKLSVPHEVIEMANAGVQRAQASVEIAQARLAQGTLMAPFDGIVTSLHVIPGEFVPASQAVITLATLDSLQVETTDLSERDIRNVHIGDPVKISIEALNQTIHGKVIGISPRADIVGGDVIFKVMIVPDSQPEDLLWGMTAEVELQSGE